MNISATFSPSSLVLVRILALLLFTSSNGSAAEYRLSVLDAAISTWSSAVSINDANQVAINTRWMPGTWIDGQVTLLDTGSAYETRATSISPLGTVTGYSYRTAADGSPTPIVWVNGQLQDLSTYTTYGITGVAVGMNSQGSIILSNNPHSVLLTPPNPLTYIQPPGGEIGGMTNVAAINDSGQIVGSATLTNQSRATLWNEQGTDAIDLGVLNENMYPQADSFAAAINDQGTVAGYSQTYNPIVNNNQVYTRAFKWEKGQMTELSALPSDVRNKSFSSYAYGINNSNIVVGMSGINEFSTRATMWNTDGQIVDINTLLDQEEINAGWVLTRALDINNTGVIVGTAFNQNTQSYSAFMLTPVPEANALAMMLTGFVCILLMQR